MSKQFLSKLNNQFPGNPEHDKVLRVHQNCLKHIQPNQCKRNDLQHEIIFISENTIESLLNDRNRRSCNNPNYNREEDSEVKPRHIGLYIKEKPFI